jgi:hypothetical protein
VPLFASLLKLSPLHVDDWLIAVLGGIAVGSLAAFLPNFGQERSHLILKRATSNLRR